MRIYLGHLPTEEDLGQAFAAFGKVTRITIKRCAFVDMPSTDEAQAAIISLDGKQPKGHVLRVNEARPRPEGRSGRV